jgi:hypothetical protein
MQWFTLLIWLLIAMLALPLSGGALLGRAALGLQAMAAVGGLALLVVFVAAGESAAAAWIACGLAVFGALAMVFAVAGLTSDRPRPLAAASSRAQALEEHTATLAGAQLPLFIVAALLTLLVALEIGT